MNNKSVLLVFILVQQILWHSSVALASESEAVKKNMAAGQKSEQKLDADPQTLVSRVGGDYKVDAITSLPDGGFKVSFKAVTPTGRFDILVLETHNLHVGLELGKVLRLSAQVVKESDHVAGISQVLVFIPVREGHSPVWMMSKKYPAPLDLKADSYIKMHAPQTDYLVF